MEGIEVFRAHVKVLHERARALTSACPVLVTIFASEATRLRQEDEASCLRTLCSSIRQQLAWASSSERGARSVHSEADLISSLVGLAVDGIIKTVSTDKQWSAFAGRLLKRPTSRDRPFGLVLVYIGSRGLPEDAGDRKSVV